MVCYGADEEVPALLVASNQKAYIYRITAPESPRPDKWLQLMCSHTLEQLTFIDIGVGYQVMIVLHFFGERHVRYMDTVQVLIC